MTQAKKPAPKPVEWDWEAKIPGCENFTWDEFITTSHNETLHRQEFCLLPEAERRTIVQNAIGIANRLQAARDFLGFPIYISSWWRSPRVEKAVGGSGANHYWGDAVDFDLRRLHATQITHLYAFFKNTSGGLGWGSGKSHVDTGFGRKRAGNPPKARWIY